MIKRLAFIILGIIVLFETGCQEDRTILPDLGIVATNDPKDAGGGSYTYIYMPLEGRPIKVWYFSPQDKPKDSRVVFVMHGVNRNASTYRNNWVNLARDNNWLLVVPEFSSEHYPGSRYYNLGNLMSGSGGTSGSLNPEEQWSFSTIESIFDDIVAKIEGNQKGYSIYGHSAGAQFVHRMMTFKENLRVERAISANAGWYTLVDLSNTYPFGVNNTEISDAQIEKFLASDMVVLLGEDDVLVDDNLNTDPPAMEQGGHRFARGNYYYSYHKSLAHEKGVPFGWTLATVPGVGHSNRNMALFAAEYFQ